MRRYLSLFSLRVVKPFFEGATSHGMIWSIVAMEHRSVVKNTILPLKVLDSLGDWPGTTPALHHSGFSFAGDFAKNMHSVDTRLTKANMAKAIV